VGLLPKYKAKEVIKVDNRSAGITSCTCGEPIVGHEVTQLCWTIYENMMKDHLTVIQQVVDSDAP
jgi:hypothetical protein